MSVKVVISCFGMKLDPEYQSHISNFKDMYIDLGIFINKHNHSLGLYSEQAIESVHYDFNKKCWENKRYKRHLRHPEYVKNLMRAVISYSSKNIS